jgi:hypothetical protein
MPELILVLAGLQLVGLLAAAVLQWINLLF